MEAEKIAQALEIPQIVTDASTQEEKGIRKRSYCEVI
jgi:hypothetical protein